MKRLFVLIIDIIVMFINYIVFKIDGKSLQLVIHVLKCRFSQSLISIW